MRKKGLSFNKRIPRTVPRRIFRKNRKGTKRRTKASAKRQNMYLVAMKGFRSRAGVVPMTRMYMEVVVKVARGAVSREERWANLSLGLIHTRDCSFPELEECYGLLISACRSPPKRRVTTVI